MTKEYDGVKAGKLQHTANHIRKAMGAGLELPFSGRGYEKFQEWNNRLFSEIYSTEHRTIAAFARRLYFGKATPHTIEDTVAEVFARLASELTNGDLSTPEFKSFAFERTVDEARFWLFGAARIVVYEFARRLKRDSTTVNDVENLKSVTATDAGWISEEIKNALLECPIEERTVFELMQDYPADVVAQRLGKSRATVYRLYASARRRLQKLLRDHGSG